MAAQTTTVTERELHPQLYVSAWRPWMSLYGHRLKPPGSKPAKEVNLSLIQKLLPDELLLKAFASLPVTSLAAAQCVCRQWRAVGAAPPLWRAACAEAFHDSAAAENAALVGASYGGSWKRMFLDRCHLRFDGVYVSRNTYLRTGAVEWKTHNPVHLVCYFRYYFFRPDGTFLYRTSPEPLARVARALRRGRAGRGQEAALLQHGRFRLEGDQVLTAMRYSNSTTTEVRSRLRLRSTVRGANNRLDIESIVSWDRAAGEAIPMMNVDAAEAEGAEAEGVEQRTYRRGLTPYVFVPWEQAQTSYLNLPVTQMDFFVPG